MAEWGIGIKWQSGESRPSLQASITDGPLRAEFQSKVPAPGYNQANQSPIITAGYNDKNLSANITHRLPTMMPGQPVSGVSRTSFTAEAKTGNWKSGAEVNLGSRAFSPSLGQSRAYVEEKTSGFKADTRTQGGEGRPEFINSASIQSERMNSLGIEARSQGPLGGMPNQMQFQFFQGQQNQQQNQVQQQNQFQQQEQQQFSQEPELRRLPPVTDEA